MKKFTYNTFYIFFIIFSLIFPTSASYSRGRSGKESHYSNMGDDHPKPEKISAQRMQQKMNTKIQLAANRHSTSRNRTSAFPGRILVKFNSGKGSMAARSTLASRFQMTQVKHIPLAGIYVYQLANGKSHNNVIRQLNMSSSVQYAEPDYLLHINTIPNDTSFASLWGMNNTGQTGGTADADIDATEAWDIGTGSSNVVVAVIDTGIDYNHPDLAANMWSNPGETPGDGVDNDGNGYIDDVHGINSITGNGNPMDDHYHGTHCAGTIGGVGNNGVGVAGVCWNVKLMALKFLSSSGSGSTSDAIECIQYAVAKGADIMSNSWGGGGYSQALYDAIEAAKNAGILFVAASGNSGVNTDVSPHYPSSYTNTNVLSVAAVDHKDNLASFSNYGAAAVDVAAPGVSIYSTKPNKSYGFLSGTSMATPHVAGLAALIKSLKPTISCAELKALIMDSSDTPASLTGKVLSNGRINAFNAASTVASTTVHITNPAENEFVSGNVTVTAVSSDDGFTVKVDFYVDDVLKATDTAAPWQYVWDTAAAGDGLHTVKAVLTNQDADTSEDSVAARVNNTGTPGIYIASPLNGASSLRNVVSITAVADYGPGIAKVSFYIDDVLLSEDLSAPYTASWNSTAAENGAHAVKAVAHGTDASVNQDRITVNTDNIIIPQSERDALIALYNSTNGDDWWDNTNWKKEDGNFNDPGTEHTWTGVTVTDNQVSHINLPWNDMTGSLPTSIGDLPKLQELELWWNYISGGLPTEIGNLTELTYLDLDYNEMSGPLPTQIGNLVNLTELWLDYNNWTGSIPAEMGNLTKLEYLYLYSTTLTGSIPAELGNLTAAVDMELDDNLLTGSIPPQLGNLTNLSTLTLYWNQLSGSIPVELGNMTNLDYLDLDGNNLSGNIPPELFNCTELDILWMTGNNFSGTIPAEIGNLTDLDFLFLDDSTLEGPLPTQIGDLVQLDYLYLDGGMLGGQLPDSMINLSDLNLANFRYSRFHTTNDSLRTFLSTRSVAWESTQTVAPANVSASAVSHNAITVSWQPIAFNYYTGGYNVYYSTVPGGPYNLFATTANKTVSSVTVTGLNPTTTYYFQLQSKSDPNVYNAFTLESEMSTEVNATTPVEPKVTVTSPNGGETITFNTTKTITWTTEGMVGNVTLEYSTSGAGGTYIPIAVVPSAAGSYNWTVPHVDSSDCVLRIREADNFPMDTSDSPFTLYIPPTLTLTAPDGGQYWLRGTQQVITWTSEKVTGNVTIDLFKNNSLLSQITVTNVAAKVYTWTLPTNLSAAGDYKIRISQNALTDMSQTVFTITDKPNSSDFNLDGHTDILFRHSTTGSNAIWYMNNQTKIKGTGIIRISNTAWEVAGTGDFNGDNYPDILWRNKTSGYNLLWYMKGTTRLSCVYLLRLSNTAWKIGAIADFNNDGHVDILWRHSTSGYNLIWYMNNNVRTSCAYITRVTNNLWEIAGTGDFNKDGNVDILWRHKTYGHNLIWFMNNTVRIGYAYTIRVKDGNWKVAATGDFNHDGNVDILFRNYKNGYNLLWYMNGTTRIGTTYTNPNRLSDIRWKIVN